MSQQATALATIDQSQPLATYGREQIQLIKDTYAKGASDAELQLFIEIAQRKGLDIFSNQITLVGRWDAKLSKEIRTPMTTIDGYRAMADRTGRYVPGQDAELKYDSKDRLFSATAFVKKNVGGEWHTISATAFYDEYVQTTKDGNPNRTWAKMPRLMLAKCAEALALRKAFPAELGGIYTQEEMGNEQSQTIEATPVQAKAVRVDDNKNELIATLRTVAGTAGYETEKRMAAWLKENIDNLPARNGAAFPAWLLSFDNETLQLIIDELVAEVERNMDASDSLHGVMAGTDIGDGDDAPEKLVP